MQWCSLALNTPMALFEIFYHHIQPRFSRPHMNEGAFWSITMCCWGFDALEFLDEKVKDKEQYDKCLREAFAGHTDPNIVDCS